MNPTPTRMSPFLVALALVWLFLAPGHGMAQEPPPTENDALDEDLEPDVLLDMSMEDLMEVDVSVVYGASKYEQKVVDAPSSVTVITADDINKYGYRTLAQALRSVRGFYTYSDLNYDFVGVRGFGRPGDYNTRLLVLVDGNRVNENIGDGAAIGTDLFLDVDLIERIEVIRGPGSSLYGSNAFFGVINIITKNGEFFNSVEVSGEFGSFDTERGRVTYGKRYESGVDVLFSLMGSNTDGDDFHFKEFNDPETNNGWVDHDGEFAHTVFGKISYLGFTLESAYVNRKDEIPTAPWDTVFGDHRTTTKDTQSFVQLMYEKQLSDTFAMTARVSYNEYRNRGWYVFDYAEEEDEEPYIVINDDRWKGRWWEGEWTGVLKPMDSHTLTFGAEYRHNQRQEQENWDEEVYLDDNRKSKNWGVYAQDEIQVLDNLIFNLGVRYDDYDSFGGTTNPRIAAIYRPLEATTLKLIYGTAFRAPTAYELYYHDGYWTMKPNEDLDSEEITTYEAIVEQDFGDGLLGTADVFYYNARDLIDQVLDPADDLLYFKNIGKVDAWGYELEASKRWEWGLRGRLSYAFVDTNDKENGKAPLSNSPRHLVKANAVVPVVEEKVFAGVEAQYYGAVENLAGDRVDDYFLTNLTLTMPELSPGLEISASVYNLLDEDYATPGFGEHIQDELDQYGRSLRIEVTYRF